MNITLSKTQLRITALWAFSEAFLGGMLHGLHVPFSGLVLSGFASICIAALTLQDHAKGKILKATILVIIVKAILSPHTPLTAYFAVLLQGFFGELIFSLPLTYFIACLFTSIFALIQTAFQKLIVLTILFGKGFWQAMDDFLNGINKELGFLPVSYSLYLVLIFISLHLLAGIAAGIFAGRLPRFIHSSKTEFHLPPFTYSKEETIITSDKKQKTKWKNLLSWIFFALLVAAVFYIYSAEGNTSFLKSKALMLFIRSLLILLLWYFFVAPLLLKWFRSWLSKQQNKFSAEVKHILTLIPEMKYITVQCWAHVSTLKGIKRIRKFIGLTFLTLLSEEK